MKTIEMECPKCGAALDHYDFYGRVALHQDGKIIGEIFKCPNGAEQNGLCSSELFHVAGAFYTDSNGILHEGFPC